MPNIIDRTKWEHKTNYTKHYELMRAVFTNPEIKITRYEAGKAEIFWQRKQPFKWYSWNLFGYNVLRTDIAKIVFEGDWDASIPCKIEVYGRNNLSAAIQLAKLFESEWLNISIDVILLSELTNEYKVNIAPIDYY